MNITKIKNLYSDYYIKKITNITNNKLKHLKKILIKVNSIDDSIN